MYYRALTIGRLAGIPIRVHWSWAATLVVVAGALGQLYTGEVSGLGPWLLAVLAALLLCASVVLHELGHAAVARRYRLPVYAITLFAVGGAIEIGDAEPDPIRDLLMALAGPLVSLLLAFVSAAAWWYGQGLLALHLALANTSMALFNLLPSYPMDGGRVVRAALWFLSGDELSSARAAARAGRGCGWMFILVSFLYIAITGDLLNAAWIVAIGAFLVRGAAVGYRHLLFQRALRGVRVADLMRPAFRAVAPDLPLDQFVGGYVLGQTDQGFPVLRDPEHTSPQPLLGMMTLRDLRRFRLSEWTRTRVAQAMTPGARVRTLAPDMPAGEALRALVESGEEQLPVVVGGTLLGMLRRSDLARHIQRRIEGRF